MKNGSVLVIDDEEIVRSVAGRILKHGGYRVCFAESGEQGLSVLWEERDNIDAVLLDMTMPDMSGEETLRKIREFAPQLPVILTSGYNQDEIEWKFNGLTLAGFIQKPYTPQALMDIFRQTLGG